MSVTINDILKLPVMKGASLLTGEAKLDNIINTISVTDYFSASVLFDDYFRGSEYLIGQIMITGFITEYSAEEQCEFIRYLSHAGARGLILFQSPPLHKNIDEHAQQLADELEFPIIRMSANKYLYSEVISEVMKAVFREQDDKNYITSMTLDHFSQLPDNQRTTDYLIRILSNYTHLSIALYDQDMNVLHEAPWPVSKIGILKEPALTDRLFMKQQANEQTFMSEEGSLLYYSFSPVSLKNNIIKYVVTVSEYNPVEESMQHQISEVIRLFFAIWGKQKLNTDELVQAIVKNELVKAKKLADVFSIDLSRLEILCISSLEPAQPEPETEELLTSIKGYLKQNQFRAIADICGKHVMTFVERPGYQLEFSSFIDGFTSSLTRRNRRMFFLFHRPLSSLTEANEIYERFVSYLDYVRLIYPHKTVFTDQELVFAKKCAGIVQQGKEEVKHYLAPLQFFADDLQDRQKELISTLAVYLLDANTFQEAAELLYVHISTVKYRIRKMNELLGYDVRKMPEAYRLYVALAILRLVD